MLMPWNKIYKQSSFTINAEWEYTKADKPDSFVQWYPIERPGKALPIFCEVSFYRMHKFPVAFEFLPMRFHKVNANYMRLVFDEPVKYVFSDGVKLCTVVEQWIPDRIAQLVGNDKLREVRDYVSPYLKARVLTS